MVDGESLLVGNPTDVGVVDGEALLDGTPADVAVVDGEALLVGTPTDVGVVDGEALLVTTPTDVVAVDGEALLVGPLTDAVGEGLAATPTCATPRMKLSLAVRILPTLVFNQHVPEPAPPAPGVPVNVQAVHPSEASQASVQSRYEPVATTAVYEPWSLSEAQWMV